jgi:hypothetical protein
MRPAHTEDIAGQLSGVWRAFRGSRAPQATLQAVPAGAGVDAVPAAASASASAKAGLEAQRRMRWHQTFTEQKCRRSRSGCANEFANETTRDEEDVASDRRRSCALRPGRRRYTGTPETRKTSVVLLITQRSQVQILPPLPRQEALFRTGRGPLACSLCRARGRAVGQLAATASGPHCGRRFAMASPA